MHRSALAPLVVGLATLLLTRPARAERPTARLTYVRDADLEVSCPDERALRDVIAGRLGYDPFAGDAAREVQIGIRRDGARLRGTVTVVDEAGRRSKERVYTEAAGACAELTATLGLAASIVIDPSSLSPRSKPAEPARTEPAPSTSPEPLDFPPEEPPPPPPPAEPAMTGRFGADVLGTAFAEPAPSLGLAVFGGIAIGRVSVDVEGRADLPRATTSGGIDASASLLLATLAPCVHVGLALACALGSAGVLQGSIEQGTQRRSQSSFYGAAGARFGVEFPLGAHVALRAHGDVLATLTRTSLDVSAEGAPRATLWETPPLSIALGIGALYHF